MDGADRRSWRTAGVPPQTWLRSTAMEHARAPEPAALEPDGPQKLLQALELMEVGLKLKRAALVRQHPDASDAELERLFRRWLLHDD